MVNVKNEKIINFIGGISIFIAPFIFAISITKVIQHHLFWWIILIATIIYFVWWFRSIFKS